MRTTGGRHSDTAIGDASVVIVACCIAGPAGVATVAGSAVSEWPGAACAIVASTGAGLMLRRRRAQPGRC